LLLVFAQHGAVLHEISHLHLDRTAGATLLQAQQSADTSSCLTCQAFAQVVNPASGTAALAATCSAPVIPARAPCYAIIGAAAPTPRSRGPPQV